MRKRWRPLLCAISAASSLATACAPRRREPPPTPPAPDARAALRPAPPTSPRVQHLEAPSLAGPELPEPAIALPLRESFTVQEAGEAPRARLRYALDGVARRFTTSAALRARSFGGSAPEPTPVPVPPFREAFALQIQARAGAAPLWQWRGESIQLEGQTESQTKGQAESDASAAAPYVLRWKSLLANRRASFTIDAQGLPERITFAEDPLREHSAPERDELTQRLLGQLVPLPAEPIGRGARWTVVTVLRQGFGIVKQTARYQLVEVAGSRLTITVDLRRVGEEQRIDVPELPAGAQAELVALFRGITGRVEIELAAPLPIAGALTVEARAHQRLTMPDGKVSEVITEDVGTLTLRSESSDGSDATPSR
jgi:hypothetical protein